MATSSAAEERLNRQKAAISCMDAAQHKDEAFPTLDVLAHGRPGAPGASGRMDNTYSFDPQAHPVAASERFFNHVPLPCELNDALLRRCVSSSQGFFPEIRRAWAIIDSQFYLWKFQDGRDMDYCAFTELDEAIVGVALVNPQRGVWNDVDHLLVLATPFTIRLIGVEFDEKDQLQFIPDTLHTCTTDNVSMTCVVGTPTGRIFMSGDDGALHELYYERSKTRLFASKWRKINHTSSALSYLVPSILKTMIASPPVEVQQLAFDASRNILYLRSESNIQAFSVPPMDAPGVAPTALVTSPSLERALAGYSGRNKRLIHIAPIPRAETERGNRVQISLVAVTGDGGRLYFGSQDVGIRGSARFPGIVHYRHPHEGLASEIKAVTWAENILLLANGDHIDVISLDLWENLKPMEPVTMKYRPLSQQYTFKEDVLRLKLPPETHVKAFAQMPRYGTQVDWRNGLVAQHMEQPRFAILTTKGTYQYGYERPVERMATMLVSDYANVQQLFEPRNAGWLKGDQHEACATGFLLACIPPQVFSQNVQDCAKKAVDHFGGHPIRAAQSHNDEAALGYKGRFATDDAQMVVKSGKHDGAFLFFRRVLADLWDFPLVQTRVGNRPVSEGDRLQSRMTKSRLDEAAEQLERFSQVLSDMGLVKKVVPPLKEGSQVTRMTSLPTFGGLRRKVHPGTEYWPEGHPKADHRLAFAEMAQYAEDRSFLALYELLGRVLQTLRFWGILLEYDFSSLTTSLGKDKSLLWKTSFREICTTSDGDRLAKMLITKLLKSRSSPTGAEGDRDAVSEMLHSRCPHLHQRVDKQRQKAEESLVRAENFKQPDYLHACKDNYRELFLGFNTVEGLREVCQRFQAIPYWDGIRLLCLDCAVQIPKFQAAVAFYRPAGAKMTPKAAEEAEQSFLARRECYVGITDMLTKLQEAARKKAAAPGAEQPVQEDVELTRQIREVTQSSDELAHVAIFDWMLANQRDGSDGEGCLSSITSPYLIGYLQRRVSDAEQHSRKDQKRELKRLVDRYIHEQKYFAAADQLLTLADFPRCVDIDLAQRIRYLSDGITCGESASPRTAQVSDLLHALVQKLESAQEQDFILSQLRQRHLLSPEDGAPDEFHKTRAHYDEAIAELNLKQILSLNDLFVNYAHHFELPECKLSLMHAANLLAVRPSAQQLDSMTTLDKVWEDIIKQARDRCERQLSPGEAQNSLQPVMNEVLQVARRYHPRAGEAGPFVPLHLVIHRFEDVNFSGPRQPRAVFTRLRAEGYSFQTLFDCYHKIYQRTVERDGSLGIDHHQHVFDAIISLLEQWTDRTPLETKLIRDRVSAIKQNLDRKVQTDTRNLKKRYHKVISEFSVL